MVFFEVEGVVLGHPGKDNEEELAKTVAVEATREALGEGVAVLLQAIFTGVFRLDFVPSC